MYKFSEEVIVNKVHHTLSYRKRIESIIDSYKFQRVAFVGIGGTYASCLQVVNHMLERSSMEVILQSAAEYYTTGNKRIDENTLVVFSSESGTTKEIVKAIEIIQSKGSKILAFIDNLEAPLALSLENVISVKGIEQLKFFMVADYLMYKEGVFDEYHDLYSNLEGHLANALIETSQLADEFAKKFAKIHHEDPIHYMVGAGNQWGATYSEGMCYFEEQHWLKTKTIHASEFFHGMFEIVEKETNVTIFVGEDKQRELSERVVNFIDQICANYTVIDTRDFPLTGIKEKYRCHISHLVMRAICDRIDVYIEQINCHPMAIRRYYRQLEY